MKQKTTDSDIKNLEKSLRGLNTTGTNAFKKISAELASLGTNVKAVSALSLNLTNDLQKIQSVAETSTKKVAGLNKAEEAPHLPNGRRSRLRLRQRSITQIESKAGEERRVSRKASRLATRASVAQSVYRASFAQIARGTLCLQDNKHQTRITLGNLYNHEA